MALTNFTIFQGSRQAQVERINLLSPFYVGTERENL